MKNYISERQAELVESFNIPLDVYAEIQEAISYIEGLTKEPVERYEMLKRELMRIWIGGDPIAEIDITCSEGEWFEKIHPFNTIKYKIQEESDLARQIRNASVQQQRKPNKKG